MKLLKFFPFLFIFFLFLSCQKDCPTESGSTDSFYWEISYEQIVGSEGGTVTDPNTGISIEIPEGALEDEVTIVVGPVYNLPVDENLHIQSSAYYFGPDNAEFSLPVTITIPYDDNELPNGVAEENLQMHRYNMDKDRLITQNATVNVSDNTISVNTSHFCFYIPGDNIPPHTYSLSDPSNIVDNGLLLKWDKNVDGDFFSYKVYYGLQANVSEANILLNQFTDRKINNYAVTGLNPNTDYYFKVFTYDQNGLVTESNEVNAKTNATGAVVTFDNSYMENRIREELNKPDGDITSEDLATITYLNLSDCQITDISILKYCKNLEDLDIYNNFISDLSPLSGLTELTDLEASYNNITDISPLSSIQSLEYLSLNYNNIEDISIIQNLTNLDNIDLAYNNVSDVRPIRNLPYLEDIDLDYNNITDISRMVNLPKLESIDFRGNKVSDISRVSSFPELTSIYADYNNISDISALSNLDELYYVDMDYNQIVDISPIANNKPDLRYIYLTHNNIEEIPDLSDLTDLRNLYLGYNNITNIDGLDGQTAVQYLYLNNNNIVDISSLATVTNITGLSLEYTPVVDLEPLVNNPGMDNGDYIYLYGANDLSETSINTHIPALQARGVNVYGI